MYMCFNIFPIFFKLRVVFYIESKDLLYIVIHNFTIVAFSYK